MGLKEETAPIHALREAINRYESSKPDPDQRKTFAGSCLVAINDVLLRGDVRQGEGLVRKLARCMHILANPQDAKSRGALTRANEADVKALRFVTKKLMELPTTKPLGVS